MLRRTAARVGCVAVLLALGALQPAVSAPTAAAALKTRNVVLIVSDGLRWQEVFSGADPAASKLAFFLDAVMVYRVGA
jgi:hypothetical protein